MSGGYLGFDIFFSEYAINLSLSCRREGNFEDFIIGIFERRIRRLISALITFTKDRPGHDTNYAVNSSKIKKILGLGS